jgi:hypothetical protein
MNSGRQLAAGRVGRLIEIIEDLDEEVPEPGQPG